MSTIPQRKLGDVSVPAIGFGVLDAAHATGCTFWDTANVYGDSEVRRVEEAAEIPGDRYGARWINMTYVESPPL
ncbi:hypothetical protein C8F04DRAFT_1275566 [Mycena alexandri]|uniref:Aldo/keto reductase n=1 Tax=Mycena alexandri TaxID=1745969 RepID=A0AAD6S2I8_9AGAR|nr:hypothetical protein C8F04DRAFT_1275566 [Mycena alexandri]